MHPLHAGGPNKIRPEIFHPAGSTAGRQFCRVSYSRRAPLREQARRSYIEPSGIVSSDGERVLATMNSDGGNSGGYWEGLWWFDRTGPHALDFSRLEAAIKNGLP